MWGGGRGVGRLRPLRQAEYLLKQNNVCSNPHPLRCIDPKIIIFDKRQALDHCFPQLYELVLCLHYNGTGTARELVQLGGVLVAMQ